MRRARDGSAMWWGEAPPVVIAPGTAASITVAVSPVRPGHAVTVEYRVNGGPVRQAIGLPELRADDANARLFRAVLPGQLGGLVEFLPMLRFAGQPISPGLAESAECHRYQVGRAVAPVVTARSSVPQSEEKTLRVDEIRVTDLPLQRRVLSDGTECPLPIRYFDDQGLLAIFLAELDGAAKLLEGTGLQAVAQEDGRAVVVLGCFDYRKTDIGSYKEVALCILAEAPSDPIRGYYVVNLPVTTAVADLAGREIWGFNKFVTPIDIKGDRKKFLAKIRDPENATIGALEGSRGASVPVPPNDMFMFSLLDGRLIKTLVRMLTPFHASSGDGFVLKVGTSKHPMASSLRALALDGARPVVVQHADSFQAVLFPGREL
jgi:Acetoacetate decarboxylase (ADC)